MRSAKAVRVLATRPAAENPGWCALLQESGFEPLAIPVLEIAAVQEPAQRQALKNLILDFDQFNKVIFVSQNAVRHTFAWLDDYWPQLPMGIEYFAVGSQTRDLLARYGVAAGSGEGAMNSEELLELPALQSVAGEKILICRGCGGRPRLAEVLQERGARVVLGEFYQRLLPEDAAQQVRRAHLGQDERPTVLSVFSGESLDNLVQLLADTAVSAWREMPLLVPGERVAQRARALGFEQVIAASNATNDAMLRALQTELGVEGKGS